MKEIAKEKERKWTEANQIKAEKFSSQDNILRPETIHPHDALKAMDTTLEGFFRKRELNLPNFNLLLLSLNAKKDAAGTEETLEKMQALGIKPDSHSYSLVLSTCAKTQDLEKTEKYFDLATKMFGKNIVFYTGLMMAYSRARRADQCLKIIEEMKSQGVMPDMATYTTLVQALKYTDAFDQCFKYYDEMKQNKMRMDEVFLTLMMKVCAKTHEAEKAKLIFKPAGKINFR